MPPNSELDELVVRIYDVVTAPQEWQEVLNQITYSLGARASNIFYGDSRYPELHGALLSDVLYGLLDEAKNVAIVEAERPLYSAIPEIIGSLKMTTESDLLAEYNRKGYPPMQLDELYRWLRETYGIHHRMTSPLNQRPSYFDFFTVHFGDTTTRPPQEAMDLSNRLLPHLAKALELNRPFALLEARYRAVLDVLDRLQLGVVLMGQDQCVWLMNESASLIIEKGDSLIVDRRKKLRGRNIETSKIMESSLAYLLNDSGPAMQKSIRTRLPRDNARGNPVDSYVADISILKNHALDSRAGFAVILVDPDRSEIVDLAEIANLFGLTHAEAAVCELLIKGLTNKEIAESRNVSQETVSTQVKSLFVKTSCRRRSDLIHLAHSINIPIDSAKKNIT